MAITTTNGKLAVMEWDVDWEPGLPMVSTSSLTQPDQQQVLWGFPEILWAAGAALAFILDLNTRIRQYVASFYGYPETADLTTLTDRYLDTELTGDYTARFHQLIRDATP